MADTGSDCTLQATLGYAGDVTAQAAWQVLQTNASALLIDVRTPPEWSFAGYPDLFPLGKEPVLLSWRLFPQMQPNPDFMAVMRQSVPDKAAPLYFLCRTGGRSREAAIAATSLGYVAAYNIQDGFDGPLDGEGRRGRLAGWRAADLPWRQE